MTIEPGFGTERLHLRQSSESLRAIFGSPKTRRASSTFRQYWIYPQARFDCIVSQRTERVLSIFFKRGSEFSELNLFERDEKSIRRIFSQPDADGGGFKAVTGDYVNRWISYDSGIGFDFDQNGQMQTVFVFARKRAAKKQSFATHSETSTHQIAALRRA